MESSSVWTAGLCLGLAAMGGGCGDDENPVEDAVTSLDAGIDSGNPLADAAPDAVVVDSGTPPDAAATDSGGEVPADAGTDASVEADVQVRWGMLQPLASYTGAQTPRGVVTLEAYLAAGSTAVYVQALGLAAETAYPAHVHVGTCAEDGLGHYKIDPSVEAADEANELWPALMTDADGVGYGSVVNSAHLAGAEAKSVIVHDPNMDGAKMACADLMPPSAPPYEPLTLRGDDTIVLTAGDERGYTDALIAGSITRGGPASARTVAALKVTGLQADKTYGAHVHDHPCDVGDGGGHYKIDPSVAEALETNEIWFSLVADAAGAAMAEATLADHIARPEAQAIVVHDPDDAARLLCYDLDQI